MATQPPGNYPIQTDRMVHRLLTEQDGELLWLVDQDPEVMRFLNDGKMTSKEDIANRMLPRMMKYQHVAKGYGIWAAFDKTELDPDHLAKGLPFTYSAEAHALLGWTLARPMNFFTAAQTEYDHLELGWRFVRKSWGKGLATEAARGIAEHLIAKHQNTAASQTASPVAEHTPIKKLTALADPNNFASIAVMKKLGMQYKTTYLHIDPLFEAETAMYSIDVNDFIERM